MDALRELLDYVCGLDSVWIARRADIAAWWSANYR